MGNFPDRYGIVHADARRSRELFPAHPERICWGCDRYCPANDLACGNGTIRTPHPRELFGDDWLEWAEGDSGGAKGEDDASGE